MTDTKSEFTSLAPSRPALHLTPPAGWMNDPNGLCKIDGTWHAFYQHDPDSITHGIMHWGHASSADLLHWEHQDIALAPDEHGVIFSGSAVVDTQDSSGFGAGALVAIFTHDLDGLQRQSLAYSIDGGRTFTKYAENPVLAAEAVDFRDPKVVAADDGWIMALAAGDRINFYSSVDLRSWESTGTYTYPLIEGGVWECPDLIHFPDSRDPAITHVLTICANHAGPYGHSGTLYVPGRFDDGHFAPAANPRLLDHGPDFYATQTFFDMDHADPVAMAWMSSWRYSVRHPARNYRGAMSLPRRIELHGHRVRQRPVLDAVQCAESVPLGQPIASDPHSGLLVSGTGELHLEVTGRTGAIATVTIDNESASIQRHGNFMDNYAEHYSAPVAESGPYQVVIDHGTIELFAAGGLVTLSALTFGGLDWRVEAARARTIHRIR